MKIFIAGINSVNPKNRYILEECDYILESFYSIKEWEIPYIKKCKMFLLDSGAFSMFTKGHNLTAKDWDDYVTRYIEFINKYDIKYFFELDVDRILGIEKVEQIRKRIEKETGKKCIPVWHKERGWKYFEKMCKEYDYVAIGGIAKNPNGKQIEKIFPYFINYAHKNNCKIHGLGYTSAKGLRKNHFDTVDSTSWLAGGQFGSIQIFDGRKITSYKKPHNTRVKTKGEDGIKTQKLCLQEWIKYQKYADKHL